MPEPVPESAVPASPPRAPLLPPPPMPAEHGSWALLATAALIGAGSAPRIAWAPVALVIAVALAVHLGRAAVAAATRKRPVVGARRWAALWSLLAAACGSILILTHGRTALLAVGLPAFALLVAHVASARWPSRRRLDRSQWMEVLAVGGLALTAPAAHIAADGRLDRAAVLGWILSFLHGCSGVFFVKGLLEAARHRALNPRLLRGRVGMPSLLYHGGLACFAAALCARMPPAAAACAAIGFGPILLRALHGWWKLSAKLPRLTRVGMLETAYALWYAGWLTAALRLASGP